MEKVPEEEADLDGVFRDEEGLRFLLLVAVQGIELLGLGLRRLELGLRVGLLAGGEGKGEDGTLAAVGGIGEGAFMQCGHAPGEIEADAGADDTGIFRAQAVEAVEDAAPLFFGNADSVVLDIDDGVRAFLAEGDADMPPVRRVLDGVADKIPHHLGHFFRVEGGQETLRKVCGEFLSFLGSDIAEHPGHGAEQGDQVVLTNGQLFLAAAAAPAAEDLLGEGLQLFRVPADEGGEFFLPGGQVALFQFLGGSQDHGERGAELVRDIGHEVDMLLVQLGPLAGQFQPLFLGAHPDGDPDAGEQGRQPQKDIQQSGPGAGPGGRTDGDGKGDFRLAPLPVQNAHAGVESIVSRRQEGIDGFGAGGCGMPVFLESFQFPGIVQQLPGGIVDSREAEIEGVLPVAEVQSFRVPGVLLVIDGDQFHLEGRVSLRGIEGDGVHNGQDAAAGEIEFPVRTGCGGKQIVEPVVPETVVVQGGKSPGPGVVAGDMVGGSVPDMALPVLYDGFDAGVGDAGGWVEPLRLAGDFVVMDETVVVRSHPEGPVPGLQHAAHILIALSERLYTPVRQHFQQPVPDADDEDAPAPYAGQDIGKRRVGAHLEMLGAGPSGADFYQVGNLRQPQVSVFIALHGVNGV